MNLTKTTIDESRGNQINETKATKRFFKTVDDSKFTVISLHDLNFSENRSLPSRAAVLNLG